MLAIIVGVVLIAVALGDSFEALVLPRRVTRFCRLTRVYYRSAWWLWRSLCKPLPAARYRENALSIFGPLSLLGLFACWAGVLIVGFALIQWGGQTLNVSPGESFLQYVYHSGETFFTLGYGDVTPATAGGKILAVVEAGTGFGFMAIVIGYLPVLYQAFSSRERTIALLDARAGSPPTAGELLRRSAWPAEDREIERYLVEWELWAAELLESQLSFPVLGYYRSQHDNQSWLAALVVVLDTSALLVTSGGEQCRRRAELTFAMARHACVDLCLIFWLPPVESRPVRLSAAELETLNLSQAQGHGSDTQLVLRLAELQALYEPFVQALSNYFCLNVPRFFPDRPRPDNWQTSAWTKRAPGITELSAGDLSAYKHFG